MKHLYLYYLLGVINFRYNGPKRKYTRRNITTAFKLLFHFVVPNVVLVYIVVIGKSGILLTVPSVEINVFYIRIVSTILAMNVNLLLNYLYSCADQTKLLNDCLATIQENARLHPKLNGKKSTFKASNVTLGIFLLHYINYELNQYTYIVLYDEKWPEFTFYVVIYFVEMINVMNILYYDSLLVLIRRTAQEDCERLSDCFSRDVENALAVRDVHWWNTIEHFYNRLVVVSQRKRVFCRSFQLQLVVIALNTFLSSLTIFFVNLTIMLKWFPDYWLEKYKRVTESLGFFAQLSALFLICYHASSICDEEKRLKHLLVQAQYNVTANLKSMQQWDTINYKLLIMENEKQIAPLNLFTLNMAFFYSIVAAIVTYLMVLFQFREFEG